MRLASIAALVVLIVAAAAPCAAAHEVPDRATTHPELLAKETVAYPAAAVEPADFGDIVFREFRGDGSFSEGRAILQRTVLHVHALASREQVVRSDAGRIVATVQHADTIGNRADVQLVRASVGEQRILALPGFSILSSDSAVPFRIAVRRPQPAAGRLPNVLPKSLSNRNARLTCSPNRVARPRTVFRAASNCMSSDHERPAARSAVHRNSRSTRYALALHDVEFSPTGGL